MFGAKSLPGCADDLQGANVKAIPAAFLIASWPIVLGLAVVAVPTLIALARGHWGTEAGAHGPLVFATGAWLLWRDLAKGSPLPDPRPLPFTGALQLAAALAVYVFGRAYDFLSLEVAGLYAAAIFILYLQVGAARMAAMWFPLLYLGFLLPVPGWLVAEATGPLKHFVSYVATEGLRAVGVPAGRQGVVLFVSQYQLLVETACSGINSLTGLWATGLLYIYLLHRASWRYSIVLALLIMPIAILVNVVRVMTLSLLTLYAGDAAAQGFLHFAAGWTLFIAALLVMAGADALMQRLRQAAR